MSTSGAPARDFAPFVSTTVSVAWLTPALAAHVGQVYWHGPDGLRSPHFRVTPNVYRWFEKKLTDLEANLPNYQRAGNVSLVELATGMHERWLDVAAWAKEAHGADALASAVPLLPRVDRTDAMVAQRSSRAIDRAPKGVSVLVG